MKLKFTIVCFSLLFKILIQNFQVIILAIAAKRNSKPKIQCSPLSHHRRPTNSTFKSRPLNDRVTDKRKKALTNPAPKSLLGSNSGAIVQKDNTHSRKYDQNRDN